MKSALKTERVILLDQYPDYHSKNFEDNPAKIAFASDITIDDTVMAGTAGLNQLGQVVSQFLIIIFQEKHNLKIMI